MTTYNQHNSDFQTRILLTKFACPRSVIHKSLFMKIEFVNHASFVIDHDNIRMISDPWTGGTAFYNGWSLISETRFSADDYKDITHIWFSHEHPDHFSPPNISRIKPEHRQNITILYQETNDKKIVDWCRQKGFKEVIELKKNTYYKLSNDFEVMNSKFFWDDSWLFVKTSEKTILNVNDCVIHTAEDAAVIRNAFSEKIDILFTQFSYAGYHGNKDEPQERIKAAQEKLMEISVQVSVFKPEIVVPFASYVWFSHQENYYMNDGINKIDKIYNYLPTLGVTPVVLYPGEIWDPQSQHNSQASVDRYMIDYEKVRLAPVLTKSATVSLSEIIASAAGMSAKLVAKYGALYFLIKLRKLKPLIIYVTDLDLTVSFSFLKGMKKVRKKTFDISMSSEVLNFCMKNDYGFNTTCINARFQRSSPAAFDKMVFYTELANSINHNHEFVAPQYIKLAIKKVLRIAGLKPGNTANA